MQRIVKHLANRSIDSAKFNILSPHRTPNSWQEKPTFTIQQGIYHSNSLIANLHSDLKLDSVGNRVDTDGVKLFCGNMAKQVADRAIQTMGGYGYVSEYHVERLWRDSKLLEIGGGTNESHHKNMTRDLARN